MRRTGEGRPEQSAGVAFGRIQLRLYEKDGPGEIGTPQVGASEVGADDVGPSQISTPQVSADEVGPSQAGTPQVGVLEVGSDEVVPPVVLVPDSGPDELADGQQQGVDLVSMRCHIQPQESIRSLNSETFGHTQHATELTVQ